MNCVTRPERRRRIDAWEVPETVSLPLDNGLLIDAHRCPGLCRSTELISRVPIILKDARGCAVLTELAREERSNPAAATLQPKHGTRFIL